jgi:hypothetical protein
MLHIHKEAIKGAIKAASGTFFFIMILPFVIGSLGAHNSGTIVLLLPTMRAFMGWICFAVSGSFGAASLRAVHEIAKDRSRRMAEPPDKQRVAFAGRGRLALLAVFVAFTGGIFIYRAFRPYTFRPGIDDPSFPMALVSGMGSVCIGFVGGLLPPALLQAYREHR